MRGDLDRYLEHAEYSYCIAPRDMWSDPNTETPCLFGQALIGVTGPGIGRQVPVTANKDKFALRTPGSKMFLHSRQFVAFVTPAGLQS